MIIKTLAVGPIMANCFILGCEKTKEAVVIDPGDETDRILSALGELKLTLKYILCTHGHFDHVGGNKKLKQATGADILIHSLDAPMLNQLTVHAASFGLSSENSPPADRTIEDGETISFGEISLKVMHTPGHSPGGVVFYTDKTAFAGDTLFAGSIGRTDLPGGDYETLISSIKNKLFTLDDDVKILPGHGPESTIGQEKRSNPFVGQA
ncbi:MAG: MBL fold metallo-hydrolase [Deltaproteobacteria bacterium]|nr:MBL fold metallo-hydrolase [Deltaproteobacteria bacterium]